MVKKKSLSARVILPVDLFEFVDVVVGVYLCGSEAAVAQKVFYSLNVGPVIEQVRGKGVPQHMGAFLFQGCSGPGILLLSGRCILHIVERRFEG